VVKYLKRISIGLLLILASNSVNFKAMNGNLESINNIIHNNSRISSLAKIERSIEHVNNCKEIGDFESEESLNSWFATYLPDAPLSKFIAPFNASFGGPFMQVHGKMPRHKVHIQVVLDLMMSLLHSKEIQSFFTNKDNSITSITLNPFIGFDSVTISKAPIPVSVGNKIMKENFLRLQFRGLDIVLNKWGDNLGNDEYPIVFIKYGNVGLSNLIFDQTPIEYEGKTLRPFIIDKKYYYVFGIGNPISINEMIVDTKPVNDIYYYFLNKWLDFCKLSK